jgi:hypothetical protein
MHKHRTESYAIGGSRQQRAWQANSLFGLEKTEDNTDRQHGYTAGQIILHDDYGSLKLWPRIAIRHSELKYWQIAPDRFTFELQRDNGTRPEVVDFSQQPQIRRSRDSDAVQGDVAKREPPGSLRRAELYSRYMRAELHIDIQKHFDKHRTDLIHLLIGTTRSRIRSSLPVGLREDTIMPHFEDMQDKIRQLEQVNKQESEQQHKIVEMSETHPLAFDVFLDEKKLHLEHVEGLSDTENGYRMKDLDNLRRVIERLFSPGLRKLQATSIHSDRNKLQAYKDYWDAPLGNDFAEKNKGFLRAGGRMERIYFCDSLYLSVKEDWFKEALELVKLNADVKVVEISDELLNSDRDPYHDYGVYYREHSEPCVLLAPRSLNEGRTLNTTLLFSQGSIYQKDFEAISACYEKDELYFDSDFPDEEDKNPSTFGNTSLQDLFGQNLIFRSMLHPKTKRSLFVEPTIRQKLETGNGGGFLRKFQPEYAEVLRDYIASAYPNIRRLVYIGDTVDNDGGLIRNLQKSGFDAYGYICEPELRKHGVDRLWFRGIYYTTRWSDLARFTRSVAQNLDDRCLAIFDIDQTVWGPKGLNEAPLKQSRLSAIDRLMESYFQSGSAELRSSFVAAASQIYSKISSIKYVKLTQDNEDYKAPIAVYLPLGICSDESTNAALTMTEDGTLDVELVDKILLHYLRKGGIKEFVSGMFPHIENPKVQRRLETVGTDMNRMKMDIVELWQNMMMSKPAPFSRFRKFEFDELYKRALSQQAPGQDKLTLNKAVLDYASYLKNRGLSLLAVSDRPDEATYNEEKSLLNVQMLVYGNDLSEEFTQIGDV